MITEEALPNYTSFFNLLKGMNNEGIWPGVDGWVTLVKVMDGRRKPAWRPAEQIPLSLGPGRYESKWRSPFIILIANGFDPKAEQDPYQAMIYTSFQERATKISHVNTGKLADKAGDDVLSRICKTIAGDEARHEKAYKSFMSKIFEIDPDGALLAFEKMMRKQITMPAMLMDDANEDNLFARFSHHYQKRWAFILHAGLCQYHQSPD